MQVEEVRISSIIVKDRAREDLGNIEELAAQITAAGRLIQPISIDQNRKLLAGGRRLAAATHLGWETISAITHNVKTKLDAKRIELLENIARKDMTWVERAKLERAIFDMEAEDDPTWTQRRQAEFLDQSHGATNRRLQLADALELLPELAEYPTEDDAWKELKKLEEELVVQHIERSRPAEVVHASKWAEDHYNVGDAFAGMADCANSSVHFAEVDPPYGVEIDRRKGRNKDTERLGEYNEVDADEYVVFYRRMATEVMRILRPDSFAVFWYGMTWHQEVLDVLRETGFGVPDIPAIWTKGTVGQTASPDTTFGSCYEPFFLARKGQPKLAVPGHDNVFAFNKLPGAKKIHPTEKPIELMEEILRTCLFPGSSIMCPFLGSGVTLRAAYKLGHTGFGWDLSARHKELFLRKVRGEVVLGVEAAE